MFLVKKGLISEKKAEKLSPKAPQKIPKSRQKVTKDASKSRGKDTESASKARSVHTFRLGCAGRLKERTALADDPGDIGTEAHTFKRSR
jgi:hypothetical protein